MYTFTKSHHALPGDCGWSKGLINPIVDCVMRRIEQMVGLCCRAQERRRAPGPLTVFFSSGQSATEFRKDKKKGSFESRAYREGSTGGWLWWPSVLESCSS